MCIVKTIITIVFFYFASKLVYENFVHNENINDNDNNNTKLIVGKYSSQRPRFE